MTTVDPGVAEIDGDRWYQLGPDRYPSVTTVLGIGRWPWRDRLRREMGWDRVDALFRAGAATGRLVHSVVAGGADGDPFDPELGAMVAAFREWQAEAVEEVLDRELVVVSRRHRFAGRLDLLVRMRGDSGLTVVDVKTGAPAPETALQTAGYRLALREMQGREAHRRLSLHLWKGERAGEHRPIEHTAHLEDERLFLYALQLWKWARREDGARENERSER